MKYDEEGFIYPALDHSRCIQCKMCQIVCPVDKVIEHNYSPEFYAGYSNSSEIMVESSSGGIFWPIVEELLKKNAVIYGAVLKQGLKVCHERGDNIEDCKDFRKSKYLQSDLTSIYIQVRKDLKEGKIVLFSGTPCQVAALYNFVGTNYKNLYTIDVVCHGVPSQKLFNKYISEQEKHYKKHVVSYCWRDKNEGWGPNHVTMIFDDGSINSMKSKENPMQKGFLDNWYLRPSCYQCQFAKIPRVADITLGDFWGYDLELTETNKNRGISLVVVSSEKGEELFNSIKDQIQYHEVTQEYACKKSRHLWIHPKENLRREYLMRDFGKGKSFAHLTRKYIMPSFVEKSKRRTVQMIKRIVGK